MAWGYQIELVPLPPLRLALSIVFLDWMWWQLQYHHLHRMVCWVRWGPKNKKLQEIFFYIYVLTTKSPPHTVTSSKTPGEPTYASPWCSGRIPPQLTAAHFLVWILSNNFPSRKGTWGKYGSVLCWGHMRNTCFSYCNIWKYWSEKFPYVACPAVEEANSQGVMPRGSLGWESQFLVLISGTPILKRNSNFVADVGYSGWIFFKNSAVEKSSNWNSNLQKLEFHYFVM